MNTTLPVAQEAPSPAPRGYASAAKARASVASDAPCVSVQGWQSFASEVLAEAGSAAGHDAALNFPRLSTAGVEGRVSSPKPGLNSEDGGETRNFEEAA